MTYYHQQALFIKETCLPRQDLCEQVLQAKEYIDHHFENEVKLADIAITAYCSKFHFLRLFKQLYGRTPHQYLTEVRISKAKQLLSAGVPVTDVCFSVGFSSISSFKGLFKRNTALTPAAWQKQAQKKQAPPQPPSVFFHSSSFQNKQYSRQGK